MASSGSNSLTDLISLHPGYFSMGKADQEQIIFAALVAEGSIDLNRSRFDLALQLRVTASKVDSLSFRYRLNSYSHERDLREISRRLKLVSLAKGDHELIFTLEDKFYRNLLEAELKRAQIYSDTSFNPEFIKVKADKAPAFFEVLTGIGANEIGAALEDYIKRNRLKNAAEALWKIATEYGPAAVNIVSSVPGLVHH